MSGVVTPANILEPRRRQLGVANRLLDRAMARPILQRPRIMPALRGLAYPVERAADPLHRTGIDTKALRYLSNSFSAPRRL